MATRRGAANLDDLKARLGYAEAGGADPSPPDASGESAPVADLSGAQSSVVVPPAHEADPPSGATAEDYSAAVSTADVRAFEFDANAVDPSLAAPPSKSLAATAIAVAAALGFGAVIGSFAAIANTTRSLENLVTDEAAGMLEAVRPVAAMLTQLDGDLSTLDPASKFEPAFQDQLTAAYGEGNRALDGARLADAATLMARSNVSQKLIDYAMGTSFLASLVERHLQATARDADEISRLEQGLADTTQYGIAIAFEPLLARVQSYLDDPAANPFAPIAAERVTYASLNLTVEGSGPERSEFYEVNNSAGQPIRVAFHDLVLLPKAQLLPPVSSENALDRYMVRAAQIKEVLSQLTTQQAALMTELESLSGRDRYFTF